MPDFDIDFCMDQRDAVIDYVRDKYGDTSVGQIATFHQLRSRSVVRDVGRVMGMSPADAGRIASLIPEAVQGKTVPIQTALDTEARLKASYKEDAGVKDLIDTAMQLENLNRHAGMHAAGVVISDGSAVGPRARVLSRAGDTIRDAVRQGRGRGGGPGQVRLPRAQDADGHRHRPAPHQLSAPSWRGSQTGGAGFRHPRRSPSSDRRRPLQAACNRERRPNVFQLESSSGMQQLVSTGSSGRPCSRTSSPPSRCTGPDRSAAAWSKDFVDRKHGRARPSSSLHPCLDDDRRATPTASSSTRSR